MTTTGKKTPRKSSNTTPPSKPQADSGVEEAVEVSPVSAWKTNYRDPIELPSGKFMRVRVVGFKAFVKMGIIPNSLMSVVEKSLDENKAPNVDDLQKEDTNLQEMFDLIDEVMIFCAQEPKVHRVPANDDERDDNLLYVDEVDDPDKMYVFGLCTGGTKDVEQFRREQADSVAAVQ